MLKSKSVKTSSLERELGLRFKDRRLLDRALVHPSYLNEISPADKSAGSYQRLEFLGDAVLGVAIALEVYKGYPHLSEGELTRLRSSLVNGKTLAKVALRLGLGQHLNLGKGEESTGGRHRESNLAAVFEALVGAVFLDRGFDKARKFVLEIMHEEVDMVLKGEVAEEPKSRLQELAQGMGESPPVYRLIEAAGPDHATGFAVEVVINGSVMGVGHGLRKADAEKLAAQEALMRFETPGGDERSMLSGSS